MIKLKILVFILFNIWIGDCLYGQNPFKDQNASFRTEDGYALNLEKAEALLDSELFYLVREKDSVGNQVYTFKRYANKSVKKLADSLFIENSFGKEFPEYKLLGMDKKNRENQQALGEISVYNFWYTGCKPCLEEIPLLNKLTAEYKDKVNFIAPTFENFKVVSEFLEKYQFDYDVLPNAKNLSDQLKIASYPTHVITDESGVIRKIYYGGSNIIDLEIKGVLESLLAEKKSGN